ncbi:MULTISPECIES: glycoside hydrolase family 5 protein [unclassified Pseudomonas]|uniref:glycoside hydrolase family 5 protein n=1 Tax=unclassified Pseudomonas TaxID=196821 RepID=UPI0025808EAA|nr:MULTISPECIES: glycoside hydrolase family 5 protein [unclassified Pseudomonas]
MNILFYLSGFTRKAPLFLSFFVLLTVQTETAKASVDLIGLNMSGAGFAGQVLPGVNGRNYIFPTEPYFQQWSAKGIRLIRFPILWERLQPTLGGPLDPTYTALIDGTFNLANKYGMKVILDLHNYMRYRGQIIGTSGVPYQRYQDIMAKIAQRWSTQPSLYAYDIMNEPHDALAYWPTAAQYGINGIRSIDNVRPIMIEGNGWAEATRWAYWNDPLLKLQDPANNIIFEAHTYFDEGAGGTYDAVDVSTLSPTYGVERVKPFIEWLKKNGRRGFIGEFGVPDNDPRWLTIMDNMLAYLRQNCIPATYWAAGPGWGTYNLSVEPVGGQDRPQWPTLKKYIDNTSCSSYGPAVTPVTALPSGAGVITPSTPNTAIPTATPTNTAPVSNIPVSLSGFDALNYIASYPDLAAAFGTDVQAATQHYINTGYKEGRVISFNPLSYIASYPDLTTAFGTDTNAATRHYILYGYREGRTVSFNALSYIASYPDLIKAFGTDINAAAKHYILNGYKEGRKISFSPDRYLAKYADLRAAFGSDRYQATLHYIVSGYKEGRTP